MRGPEPFTITALAAGLVVGAIAQTRDPAPVPPPQRSIITAEAQRTPPVDQKSADDTEFLVEALRTSLGEIKMGELAEQRAGDPRVRDYGTRIARDHAANAAEIERMLQPLNVTIPEEPSAEALSHHAALARLSPEEFDAAFVQMMIWTHEEAIEKYGAQTHANPDRSLHDFATRSLPMLREHLAAAEALR
jgi:putative membrane protein